MKQSWGKEGRVLALVLPLLRAFAPGLGLLVYVEPSE